MNDHEPARRAWMQNGLALLAASALAPAARGAAQMVYELRIYTANEGKLEALLARFRNHTAKLFEKHGIKNIGYWVPSDLPRSHNTLIYIVAHKSREAAKASWQAFRNDPDWKKAQAESEKDGKLTAKVESIYMDPADFSPMQ